MRHAFRLNAPAPSSSLLRFLRSQSEDICFFTSNSRAEACRRAHCRSFRAPLNIFSTSRRHINTTVPRQATVQHLSLGIDQPESLSRRQTSAGLSVPSSVNRHLPCISKDNASKLHAQRYASTESRPLLRRLLGRRKADAGLNSNDLPPLPSFLDDVNGSTLGRSKTAKGTNELKLRCTEFNEDGKVTLVNGEFKKTELIAKVCYERKVFSIASDSPAVWTSTS